MRRGKDGTAILIRLNGGIKGADLAGNSNDLGLIHADQRAQNRQVLRGVGAGNGLHGLAGNLC